MAVSGSPRFLVVTPVDEGWREVKGARWYFHGGERYRGSAEAALSPHGQVEHLDWTPDRSVESFAEALDAGLAGADALVTRPGSGSAAWSTSTQPAWRGRPG